MTMQRRLMNLKQCDRSLFMSSLLITGATGFIGSSLISRLKDERHDICQISSKDGDISVIETWFEFPEAQVVIHLAGKTFVPKSWEDPLGFFNVNIDGTYNALEYCRKYNARLIFASAYLYGIPESLPISEKSALKANNPYALSKKMAEEMCQFYAEYYNVKVTILRLFNVYGHGQSEQFLIPSIINQVKNSQSIIVKDLLPRRDYVYIDDLLEAFIAAVNKPQDFLILNIASGTSYSPLEIIELVQDIAGTDLPVISEGKTRLHEIMDTKADISLASEILSWKPRCSISYGLKELLGANLS